MTGIATQFKNLRVRTKLYLFMLLPIMTMLSLGGIAINEKYSEKIAVQEVYRFSTITFDIADLVHELQKERGLSAGFVGSEGALYREALKAQRQQTQQKLLQLRQRLKTYDPLEHFWGLHNQFTPLLLELQQLPEIRYQIDQLDKGKHFDYYSSINDMAIGIIQYLQVKSHDSALSRLSDSYSLLLELQERSGQERGALNGVFSQHKLNSKEFQEILVYIALQKSTIRHYFTIAEDHYQHMLQRSITHPVVAEVEAMRAAAFNKWERNELLNELHSLIGYGGLIHDFKNYVIRGEGFYYERFTTTFFKAQQALSRFRQIGGLGNKELAHIDTLKTTFLSYRNLLDIATKMHSAGTSMVNIDKAVRIDDTPALSAIKALRSDITTLDTSTWWSKATQRIALIKEVSDATREDIIQTIHKQRMLADRGYLFYITLMLSVLTVTLLLGYLLVRRLANETSRIAAAMHQMRHSGNFDQLLKVEGDDEIGEIVSAFNHLVNRRNQTEKDRLELQQQLLDTQKREALLTLSGGMAHNFNNKLTTILGYTSLALNQREIVDSPKVKGYLTKIGQTTEEASGLIEKILTYSQSNFLSSNKSILIEEVVKKLIAHQQQQLPSNIRLTHHIEEGLPPLYLDSEQFKQMFVALFVNAMEAIEDDGLIEINLQLINIDGETCSACGEHVEGRFIELSIEDNGIGITPKNMEHIFEPFFTTKDLSEGAGMGLAMAFGFINKSDGHAIVESAPGKGTKVRVVLPIADKEI